MMGLASITCIPLLDGWIEYKISAQGKDQTVDKITQWKVGHFSEVSTSFCAHIIPEILVNYASKACI